MGYTSYNAWAFYSDWTIRGKPGILNGRPRHADRGNPDDGKEVDTLQPVFRQAPGGWRVPEPPGPLRRGGRPRGESRDRLDPLPQGQGHQRLPGQELEARRPRQVPRPRRRRRDPQ